MEFLLKCWNALKCFFLSVWCTLYPCGSMGTDLPADDTSQPTDNAIAFKPLTAAEARAIGFKFCYQWPWRKIAGQIVLQVTIAGSLPIDLEQQSYRYPPLDTNPDEVNTLPDFIKVFMYGAHDPRVEAIVITVGKVTCGYGKLQELMRYIAYFQASGKQVIGYADNASEKEYYLACCFDEFYMPPEGHLDLRGFTQTAVMARGLLDKIGIELEEQCVGKYKANEFNCLDLSEERRSVMQHAVTALCQHWCQTVAAATQMTEEQVMALLDAPTGRDVFSLRAKGLLRAVVYKDQVIAATAGKLARPAQGMFAWSLPPPFPNTNGLVDFSLSEDYQAQPRRTAPTAAAVGRPSGLIIPTAYPAQTYLSKMCNAASLLPLPLIEGGSGQRIAVINVVGYFSDGAPADAVIRQLQQAAATPDIVAVVLRVDCTGGTLLAADLIWREVRLVSAKKPVVASLVDIAASGGYYLAVGCDAIVAEERTVCGSIGVLSSKLNLSKLYEKLGIGMESVSVGKYADIMNTARSLRDEEAALLEGSALRGYDSFVSKVAASRGIFRDDMEQLAQGRLWTGQEAVEHGLVDHVGGLWKALEVASELASYKPAVMKMQIFPSSVPPSCSSLLDPLGMFGKPIAESAIKKKLLDVLLLE